MLASMMLASMMLASLKSIPNSENPSSNPL
jgi:hypothetical protein